MTSSPPSDPVLTVDDIRAAAACLRRHGRIVSSPIHDIERSAGGSVRCMLAEIHLPRR